MAKESQAKVATSRTARELARSKMTKEQIERLRRERKRRILRNRIAAGSLLSIILIGAVIIYTGKVFSGQGSTAKVGSSLIKSGHHHITGGNSGTKSGKTDPNVTSPVKVKKKPKKVVPPNPYVGVTSCTFIDYTRSTFNYYTGKSLPYRVLDTYIFYPKENPDTASSGSASVAATKSPYPAIVFAEGYKVTPFTYRALLDFWVTKGFVVVAPMFPDTNKFAVKAMHNVETSEKDNSNEPADIAFVTRNIIADATQLSSNCKILYNLINPNELMLAGQSDGAQVAGALVYDSDYNYLLGNISFKAVEILSGDEIGTGNYTATSDSPPVLFTQSDTDTCNPPQEAEQFYDAIPSENKWFLELFNAHHLPPYDGNDPAAFSIVSQVTAEFFILAVHNTLPNSQFVALANSAPAIANMTVGQTAPNLPNLSISSKECYIQ